MSFYCCHDGSGHKSQHDKRCSRCWPPLPAGTEAGDTVWETTGFVTWKADPLCTYCGATRSLSAATVGLFQGWTGGKGESNSALLK